MIVTLGRFRRVSPRRKRWRWTAALGAGVPLALALLGLAGEARAADTTAPLVLNLQNQLELWRNTTGGLRVGDAELDKLQIIAEVHGDALGAPGWSARLQYFRTFGQALSGHLVGDIQTVSSIEAVSTDRLMEAWVQRRFGDQVAVRAGLMDLNADFDSIAPAALFINSSHGIGPDISKTGLNGPSIFPVSALGVHLVWSPSQALTLRAAVFDGVPGDPNHQTAFAAVEFSRRNGALLIGQADWLFASQAQLSFGVWGYTASFARIAPPGSRQQGQAGAYAFVEGPLPGAKGWSGWVRAGFADPDVNVVAGYVGLGVVRQGTFPGRAQDQFGFAIAHAVLGQPVRERDGLPPAETSFEFTYSYQANQILALQPDLQYVRHPASQPGLKDALAIGVRMTVAWSHDFGGVH